MGLPWGSVSGCEELSTEQKAILLVWVIGMVTDNRNQISVA